ncbi:VOC family protein [Kineobactrum salinum]|uniref:VOC family protein n=1 Tax=Kineobactrum salinum TaxID=2708301 RepID=A0A6C0U155_9GAMM|nr:VOC family protein [Kineobactrum salinum]QIB65628.1 VOC family protein [Kineobactrum salinum]
MTSLLARNAFFQSCWVVNDIHAAMQAWHTALGAGPFYYLENQQATNCFHKDSAATSPIFNVAFAYHSGMQIELISQSNNVPSAYRDLYLAGFGGHHHLGANVADYQAVVAQYREAGYQVVQEATYNDQPFCYLDTSAELGYMLELFQWNNETLSFMMSLNEEAQNWDGKSPFREFS